MQLFDPTLYLLFIRVHVVVDPLRDYHARHLRIELQLVFPEDPNPVECFLLRFWNLVGFFPVDFPGGEFADFFGEIDGGDGSVFEVPLVLFFG